MAVAKNAEPESTDTEFLTIGEAARYLKAKPNTLQNWITNKRFTADDGLRRFGGLTRIHFPTMKQRAIAGKLMVADNGNGSGRVT